MTVTGGKGCTIGDKTMTLIDNVMALVDMVLTLIDSHGNYKPSADKVWRNSDRGLEYCFRCLRSLHLCKTVSFTLMLLLANFANTK